MRGRENVREQYVTNDDVCVYMLGVTVIVLCAWNDWIL